MEGNRLSKKRAELFRRFLNTHADYNEIARRSGFSWSTVNNLLAARADITDRNMAVIKAANDVCRERIEETKNVINAVEKEGFLRTLNQ